MKRKLAAFMAVLFVLECFMFTGCGVGGEYEAALENYVKANQDGDVNAARSLERSSKYWSAVQNAKDFYSEYFASDLDKHFKDEIDRLQKYYEDKYGDNVKISYKIKSEKKLEDHDLESIISEYKNWAESYHVDYTPDISEGYDLKVEFEYKGDKSSETNELDLLVYKMDGEWVCNEL